MGAERANSHCRLLNSCLATSWVIFTVLISFVFLVFYAISPPYFLNALNLDLVS